MLKFENPFFIKMLLLIPLLLVFYVLYFRWKKRSLRKFGETSVIKQLMLNVSTVKQHLKFSFFLLSLSTLLVAMANPLIGSKIDKAKRKGIDIIIALDVSNSMLAQDIKPSRIDKAKQSISKLIEEMENDRIGIVVFAGKAYTQLPITTDYNAARLMLSTIKTDIVPVQGTAIGQAIEVSAASFKNDESNKAIIIITDGENHEDDAIEIAKKCTKNNINIYTIGMGLTEGAPIPIYANNKVVDFKKDRAGSTVITRLDETMLQQIASAGKGIYVRASNSNAGLQKIYNEINKLEKSEVSVKNFSEYNSYYQYLIVASIVFLFLSIIIMERKNKLFKNLTIFKTK